jgi:hypothetical protein
LEGCIRGEEVTGGVPNGMPAQTFVLR